MSIYLVGNVFGRLVVSYALVWLVFWLAIARLDWRNAFRHTCRWYGVLAFAAVFMLGMVAYAAKSAIAG